MGSNAQRRREQRENKVAQLRKDEKSRQRRSSTLLTIGLVIVVVLAVGGVWWAVKAGTQTQTTGAIEGVKSYENLTRNHTEKSVDYPQSPPVGGDHNPQWLDCTGTIYDKPVDNEHAVHALEHGAVWVTYDPSLTSSDIDALKTHIDGSYIFMSPYSGQQAPVEATAWGKQLELDGVDDPRLDEFISEYRQGDQTPEPGAPCDPASPMPSG